MSRSVDSRVVEMRFDNKDFESNVAQSMSTLDKLKQALNFGDAGKSLENISKAAADVNVGSIGDAIDTVKDKFSALEIAGITALVNLTNKAVDAGAEMVKSLTIDQVTAGWDKYQTKTSAVATIMAATRHEFADEAEQMEYVNAQLDKLNWFTDETSFNLVDMVDNIGKFTSAGVALDDAVTAMQGIAEWGYMSGSNINQISHAMYNLSQAMGTGKMQVIDWKSIENANMATMEFKQLAIQAGLEMGTLKQSVDEFGNSVIETVNTGLAKKFSGMTVTAQNFRDTLSDAWLTSEVMIKAFSEYGNFTELLYEALNATGLEAKPMLDMIEQYADGLLDIQKAAEETGLEAEDLKKILDTLSDPAYELGRAAFIASQECRTFADVINYTKDAVSTGWMKTFEILLGDYQEVKKVWGALADVFYELFVKSGEARNEILKAWAALGGRDQLLNSITSTYQAAVRIFETVGEAFREVFPEKDVDEQAKGLFNLTQRLEKFTQGLILSDEAADGLKKRLKPIFTTIKNITSGLAKLGQILKNTVFESVKKLAKPVASLLQSGTAIVKHVFGPLMKVPKSLWNDFIDGFGQISEGALDAVDKFSKWIQKIADTLASSETFHTKYLEWFTDISRILAKGLTGFLSLTETINSFERAGGGAAGVIQIIIDKLSVLSDTVISLIEHLTGWDLSGLRDNVTGFLGEAQTEMNGFVSSIMSSLSQNDGAFVNFGNGIAGGAKFIKDKIAELTGLDLSGVDKVLAQIPGAFAEAEKYVEGVLNGEKNPLNDLAMAIGYGAYLLEQKISEFTGIDFTGFNNALMNLPATLASFGNYVKKVISGEANPFTDLGNAIGNGALLIEKKISELTGIDFTGFNSFVKDISINVQGFAKMVKDYFSGDKNAFKDFGNGLAEGARTIKTALLAWAGLEIGPLDQKTQEMVDSMDRFVSHFDGFFKLIKGVFDIILAVAQLIEPVAQVIGEVLSALAKNIVKAAQDLQNVEGQDVLDGIGGIFGKIAEFFKGIDFAGILGMIRDIGLAAMGASIAEFLTTIINAIRRVEGNGGVIEGLESMSKAILMIVGSILLINTMDPADVEKAKYLVLALLGFMGSMEAVLIAVAHAQGGAANVGALAGFFTAVGIAALACTFSIKMIADYLNDTGDYLSVGVALAAVVGVLIGIGVAMAILGRSVKADQLAGVAGVMLALGNAAKKIAKAIKAIAEIGDIGASIAAAVELGALLVAMGGAIALMGKFGGNAGNLIAAAASILIVTGALKVLVSALVDMAKFGAGKLWEPLAQLGLALAGFTASLLLLSDPKVLLGASAIMILSAALLVLSQALIAMGGNGAESGIGLAIIAGFLIEIGVAAYALTPVLPALYGLAAVFASIGIAAAGIGAGIMLAAEGFSIFVDALERGYPVFKQIFEDIIATAKKVWDWFLEKYKDIWEWIKKKVGEVAKWIGEKLKAAWDAIVKFFKGIWDWITQKFKDGWDAIVKGIKDFWEGLKKKVSDAWKWIKDKFAEFKKAVGDKISEFWKKVTEFFKKFWESITGFFKDIGEEIGKKIGEFLDKGREIITNLKKGAEEKFEWAIGGIVQFFTNLKDSIKKKIEDFVSIGSDIIAGIKKGISDAWEGFTGWVGEKLGGWVDGIESFFGIGSPSKMFAEIGGFLVEGLGVGVGKSTGIAVNAMKKMAEKVQQAAAEELSNMQVVPYVEPVSFDDIVFDGKSGWIAADIGETISLTPDVDEKKLISELNTIFVDIGDTTTGITPAINEEGLISELNTIFVNIGDSTTGITPTVNEESLITGMESAFADVEDEPIYPTVVPVVDMSGAESDMDSLTAEIGTSIDVSIADLVQTNMNGFESVQNEIRKFNIDMNGYVDSLREDIAAVKETLSNLKVVMDSGKVVGALSGKFDKALGRQAVLARRGV